MKLTLFIWRQKNAQAQGKFEKFDLDNVSPDMSFLEMLDTVIETQMAAGIDPIYFDHDCREGICGACSLVINGTPHGPELATTTCQLHMRKFKEGDTIYIEPFRSKAFTLIKDLTVDRASLDRIIQAGGFVSVPTGAPQDANALPISKVNAELAMDAAACIGCGACVASCPNGAAMLFTSAKMGQLALLPQGQPERRKRALAMVKQMESEGFGSCRNYYECEAACPKGISVRFIAKMNREFMKASIMGE
ncbi:MAG: succinate dehydrogenase/fumarate reductase iron-sulfur subunit [Candidatus Kapabacteria bacterium]|jgi:succinate dehydrogenase / fumarate reductase iron-sulfur subunit|nr:succinate dehydrogenase/fumarate reductase iron-sulfur subunit [Candidatus Kapabacteria bacterium]